MSPNRKRPVHTDEESNLFSDGEGEQCPVCHQEYANGICPINSADCPYREDAEEEDEEEEDDESDFEDVERLDGILKDDEEADRLTEEAEDFSEDEDADDRNR